MRKHRFDDLLDRIALLELCVDYLMRKSKSSRAKKIVENKWFK